MSATATTIAAGQGWEARDVVCLAGRGDAAFEEEHRATCVALVIDGMFGYRTRQGDALMVPGALLLGNAHACYECGHDHAAGDRCLSFHFSGEFHERVLVDLPGARRMGFRSARLPPMASLARLAADARAAHEEADADALAEVALRVAGAAATLDAELDTPKPPRASDVRRIVRAIGRVEQDPEAPHGLDELAAEARFSPYHFLRSFAAVTGMTPHQYVLKTRLGRAADRLRRSDEKVSTIALDAGFNDLSTFNRRFRKVMGATPLEWRRLRRNR